MGLGLIHDPRAHGSFEDLAGLKASGKQHTRPPTNMVTLIRFRRRVTHSLPGLVLIFVMPLSSLGFNFHDGDLLLGFRQVGAASDVIVNLGAATNFNHLAELQNGGSITITNYPVDTLTSAFPDLTGVDWSALGSYLTVGDPNVPSGTCWATRARTNINVKTDPWLGRPTLAQKGAAIYINSIGQGALQPPGSSDTVAIIPAGASYGYSAYIGPGGDLLGKWAGGSIEGTIPADFISSKLVSRLDLYFVKPSPTNAPGEYLGYLDFRSDATMTFTAAGGQASIQVPQITWAKPADITFGTPLGTNQLNAVADTQGNFVYLPPSGTVLSAGAGQALTAAFTPSDTSRYTNATATVQLNVLQAMPTLNWPTPGDIIYGAALGTNQLAASANVPGSFTYTPPAGTVLQAGSGQKLSVTFQPADSTNYANATGTVNINVLKAMPQLTWVTPADMTAGTPLGTNQLNATANVPGSFAYAPLAGTVLAPGAGQQLSTLFTPTDTNNYTTATATVTVNVVGATQSPQFDLTGIGWTGAGFQVRFSGASGQQYDVEASEDLRTWTKLATVPITAGVGTYLDAGAVGRPQRYYRLRDTPPHGP
jgi:hypothetical protein